MLNFVKILCEKGTLRELPGCARAFRVKYNQAHGILEATAVTAVPMSADQTARLHEKLEAVTGKTIDLRTKVDATVLGGIRLDIEGTELDGTVKTGWPACAAALQALPFNPPQDFEQKN